MIDLKIIIFCVTKNKNKWKLANKFSFRIILFKKDLDAYLSIHDKIYFIITLKFPDS